MTDFSVFFSKLGVSSYLGSNFNWSVNRRTLSFPEAKFDFSKYWDFRSKLKSLSNLCLPLKKHRGLSNGTADVNLLLEVSVSRNGVTDL